MKKEKEKKKNKGQGEKKTFPFKTNLDLFRPLYSVHKTIANNVHNHTSIYRDDVFGLGSFHMKKLNKGPNMKLLWTLSTVSKELGNYGKISRSS